ncbi:AzlC family ABC transporter permease [Methanococcus voltae]|uniref:AzlC family protein n=1 Tax=Methanococcus voltae (strain ATCC BAA-1334 / A3) TaxID=456320 RepID=D7DSI0_METV3|nr:AzlC family ABC transporter permease [Methanococcus voltae]MCS3901991.1 4-azaleucine resistance transporter AzlC [Methanococcus voltae]
MSNDKNNNSKKYERYKKYLNIKKYKNSERYKKYQCYFEGFEDAIPISIGYIPIAVAFGILAKSAGIPDYICVLMSLIVFAGASQFIGVNLIALGSSSFEIIITTFILNLRHFLMSSSLSQQIDYNGKSNKILSALSFGITDETFVVASLKNSNVHNDEKDISNSEMNLLNPEYLFMLNFTAFFAWVFGTFLGVYVAEGLPPSIQACLGIALYAMFIGLLIPAAQESKKVLNIIIIALITSSIVNGLNFWVLMSYLSTGWIIIFSTLISALISAYIYPIQKSDE